LYTYIVKRILQSIFVIFGVSIVIFFLIRIVPGDPARLIAPSATEKQLELIREDLGLDKPIHLQYVQFIKDVIRGDFGESIFYKKQVVELIKNSLPKTLLLIGTSLLIALFISIPIGILGAIKPNKLWDKFSMAFSLVAQSMPNLWIGLMLIMIVAMHLKLLPVVGYKDFSYIILPAIALSISMWAVFTRTIRVSLGEVLQRDFIKGAISRGISIKKVVLFYAFKNILPTLMVVIGIQIGVLFGGAMIIEYIFNFPGIGLLTVNAVLRRDYPLIQILVILMSAIFMFVNLFVDIAHITIDPRVRGEK